MLLDLELEALSKYLSPNKLKLQSKGVESVVSRVLNLRERLPDVSHEMFCQTLAGAFRQKWIPTNMGQERRVNEKLLTFNELSKIPKLMDLYEGYKRWEWRFG
jgi:lipoate-protein ligase A